VLEANLALYARNTRSVELPLQTLRLCRFQTGGHPRGPVLVLRIARSWRGPHAVSSTKASDFRSEELLLGSDTSSSRN
jgi:hypothetical protein